MLHHHTFLGFLTPTHWLIPLDLASLPAATPILLSESHCCPQQWPWFSAQPLPSFSSIVVDAVDQRTPSENSPAFLLLCLILASVCPRLSCLIARSWRQNLCYRFTSYGTSHALSVLNKYLLMSSHSSCLCTFVSRMRQCPPIPLWTTLHLSDMIKNLSPAPLGDLRTYRGHSFTRVWFLTWKVQHMKEHVTLKQLLHCYAVLDMHSKASRNSFLSFLMFECLLLLSHLAK